ncbi:hypothetical protein MAR_033533 [Mya arenaria]|uniref:Uncharacterized protein n=1 Tax=Mya arenaria TaxID=6604 RepID=A0ABY7GDF4_MYAAR|nr:hypothetical protein MAR_033533 [Mya arenaria]
MCTKANPKRRTCWIRTFWTLVALSTIFAKCEGFCFEGKLVPEMTVSKRVRFFCEVKTLEGSVVRLLPGSHIYMADQCMDCVCDSSGLHCCGHCEAIHDGCHTMIVNRNDHTKDCANQTVDFAKLEKDLPHPDNVYGIKGGRRRAPSKIPAVLMAQDSGASPPVSPTLNTILKKHLRSILPKTFFKIKEAADNVSTQGRSQAQNKTTTDIPTTSPTTTTTKSSTTILSTTTTTTPPPTTTSTTKAPTTAQTTTASTTTEPSTTTSPPTTTSTTTAPTTTITTTSTTITPTTTPPPPPTTTTTSTSTTTIPPYIGKHPPPVQELSPTKIISDRRNTRGHMPAILNRLPISRPTVHRQIQQQHLQPPTPPQHLTHADQAAYDNIMEHILSRMREDTSSPVVMTTPSSIHVPRSFSMQNFLPQTKRPSDSIMMVRKMFADIHSDSSNSGSSFYTPTTQPPMFFNDPLWGSDNFLPMLFW